MKGKHYIAGIIIFLSLTIYVFYFLPPEAEESPPLPISVDIVVIGRGIPALTAALEASFSGAEVMLIDNLELRDEYFYPMGGRFIASFIIEEEEDEDEPEEPEGGEIEEEIEDDSIAQVLSLIRNQTPGINEDLLEIILEKSKETLNWLEERLDVNFYSREEEPHHFFSDSFSNPEDLEESLYNKTLPRLAYNLKKGEPLEILTSEEGNISGLLVQDEKGEEITVITRGIILATGGYGNNFDIIRKHNIKVPFLENIIRTSGTKGEAIKLTEDLGAEVVNMEKLYLSPVLLPEGRILTPNYYPILNNALWVNNKGEDVTPLAVERMASLWEERINDFFIEDDEKSFYLLFKDEEDISRLSGLVFVEDKVDMVSQTNLPLAQIKEINQYFPVPYYLARIDLHVIYSIGGLKVDGLGRVSNPQGVIPGLYAIGETTGSLMGEVMYPGLPLTEALVMGRIVGKEAAIYSKR